MDWEVGKKYGDYKLVEINPSTATFEMPDGSKETYPNIFQEKKDRVSIPERPERKPRAKNVPETEDTLQQQLAALQARKAKLAAIKAAVTS